jgi:hypothetical protein
MSELRVVFLGTSAGRPTPRRSVSAVYLQFGADSVLFDCGEGTQLQVLKAGVRIMHARSPVDVIVVSLDYVFLERDRPAAIVWFCPPVPGVAVGGQRGHAAIVRTPE